MIPCKICRLITKVSWASTIALEIYIYRDATYSKIEAGGDEDDLEWMVGYERRILTWQDKVLYLGIEGVVKGLQHSDRWQTGLIMDIISHFTLHFLMGNSNTRRIWSEAECTYWPAIQYIRSRGVIGFQHNLRT